MKGEYLHASKTDRNLLSSKPDKVFGPNPTGGSSSPKLQGLLTPAEFTPTDTPAAGLASAQFGA